MTTNETDCQWLCVGAVVDLGCNGRCDLLGLETVVSSGISNRDWVGKEWHERSKTASGMARETDG